jgi:excisionase family DNA binding protein
LTLSLSTAIIRQLKMQGLRRSLVTSESLMTVEQVADYLNVPVKTVYRWRLTGTGPRGARVGRYVRFRRADVEAWVERRVEEERAARA